MKKKWIPPLIGVIVFTLIDLAVRVFGTDTMIPFLIIFFLLVFVVGIFAFYNYTTFKKEKVLFSLPFIAYAIAILLIVIIGTDNAMPFLAMGFALFSLYLLMRDEKKV